jgi:hypothetical protein
VRGELGCTELDPAGIAVVGEALPESLQDLAAVIDQPEQWSSTVAGDVAAVESSREGPAVWGLGLEALLGTLCHRWRRALGDVVGLFIPPLFEVPALRSSLLVTDWG